MSLPLALPAPVEAWWTEHAEFLVTVPLRIALILVLAIVLRYVAVRLIKRAVTQMVSAPRKMESRIRSTAGRAVVDKNRRIAAERRKQRAQTLGQMLGSIATLVIFATAVVLMLGELGVALGPIIASAGIVGLAIGFGAQTLVADYLSGIFMLMEDQYGVGDWVDVGDASGAVEEVGLRVTQLRDLDGVLWFVRNSQIYRVGNHSQDWAQTVLDVPVGYDQDIDRAGELVLAAARGLTEDSEYKHQVLDEPELWGVQDVTADAVVLRLAVRTAPLEQWAIARELRKRIKSALDQEGVRMPLPQQVLWTPEPGSKGPAAQQA